MVSRNLEAVSNVLFRRQVLSHEIACSTARNAITQHISNVVINPVNATKLFAFRVVSTVMTRLRSKGFKLFQGQSKVQISPLSASFVFRVPSIKSLSVFFTIFTYLFCVVLMIFFSTLFTPTSQTIFSRFIFIKLCGWLLFSLTQWTVANFHSFIIP